MELSKECRPHPWPATSQTLLEYICARAQGFDLVGLSKLTPSTIDRHLSALRSYHVNRAWPCDAFSSEQLRRAMQGISNCFTKPKRLRKPLSADLLLQILRAKVQHPSARSRIDELNFFTAIKTSENELSFFGTHCARTAGGGEERDQ